MSKKSFSRKMTDNLNRSGEAPGRGWHSNAYHRYFEGYSEYETLDSRGKTVIRRVYEGTVYSQNLDRKQRVKLHVLLGVLWLAGAAVFALAATRPVPANMLWYSVLPQFAVLGFLVWALTALVNYYMAPEKMTVADYNTGSRRLVKSSLAALIAMLLCAAVYLICAFAFEECILLHLLCAALCGVSALLMLLVNRLESNVTYTEEKSGEKVPEGTDASSID